MNVSKLCISIAFICTAFYSLNAQRICYVEANGVSYNSKETLRTTMDIAGFPFDIRLESSDVLSFDVIFFIDGSSVSHDDVVLANSRKLLNRGGVFFADYYGPLFSDSLFYVKLKRKDDNGIYKTDKHQKISFDTETLGETSLWMNDSLESEFILCKEGETSFNVYELEPIKAKPVAYYEDGSVAVTCFEHGKGKGKAFFFAQSLKRLVAFPRNNRDPSAQRYTSNGFEPGADIIPLLIRGIIEDQFPVTVWKHTLPKDYKSALVITHDVDKARSYENAQSFIDYEKEHGIPAHYFIGTKYVSDSASGPLYDEYQGKALLNTLLDAGFTVGSNGVGGFTDFDDDDVFPLGTSDVSAATYSPFYNDTLTTGGTVLGETMVSQQILERDGGQPIRSYRSGRMRFNKYLPEGLETAGYTVESSFRANDVMTGFPYFLQKGQSSTAPLVDVLEIPVHLSDAVDYLNADEYHKAVDIWEDVIGKYSDNYAPVTLAIDTDKDYKLAALDELLQRIEGKTELVNFEDLNDFWRERRNLTYRTDLDSTNKVLTITIPESVLPISDAQSLHITKGKSMDSISVVSDAGMPIDHKLLDWDEESYLLRFESSIQDFKVEKKVNTCLEIEAKFSFADTSLVVDSLLWDFGDGQQLKVYNANVIAHTYVEVGSFDVRLTVWNNGVKTSIEKKNVVQIEEPPVAKFKVSVSDTGYYAPLLLHFSDDSELLYHVSNTYQWSFFDHGEEVQHTDTAFDYEFTQAGVYHINYSVSTSALCLSDTSAFIVVKDALQKDEISYIIGDCGMPCDKGIHYRIEADTLIIYGTVTKNCCADNTAVLQDRGDTITIFTFETYPQGGGCDCVCDYCFELKVPDFTRKACELRFEDTVIHIDNNPQSLEALRERDIWLQPNPTTGMVQVKVLRAYTELSVAFYSLQGVLLSQNNSISEALEVPIKEGVCILKITVDGRSLVKRVVKM